MNLARIRSPHCRAASVRFSLAMAGLLAALAFASPAGAAGTLSGNLTASSVFLEGTATTKGHNYLVHLGHRVDSFTNPPAFVLRGESVVVNRDFNERTQTTMCQAFCTAVDTQQDRASAPHSRATIEFASWQASRSDFLAAVGEGYGAGSASIRETFASPTPLKVTERDFEINFASDAEKSFGVDRPYGIRVAGGSLFHDGRPADQVVFDGNFFLYVFGATFTVREADGKVTTYQTGLHDRSSAVPTTRSQWLNITTLQITNGHLEIVSKGNAVRAYAPTALIEGVGLVHLDTATGLLRLDEDDLHQFAKEAIELEGAYRLDVKTTSVGGVASYSLGVAGEFKEISFAASLTTVASYPRWSWVLVPGLVMAAGLGSTLVIRQLTRRRRREPATALPAEAPRILDSEPLPAPEPSLPKEAPGLAWDELTEEFGVVHAGEKAGIFVVLVPEARVSEFVHAVAGRGLIAEDTGDRVQAGEHPLAVVAIEPAPVMMN